MTVALPDRGDGTRRRRRQQKKQTTRSLASRILLVVVLLGLLAAIGWVAVSLLGDDDQGSESPPASDEQDATGGDDVDPALVVLTNDAGEVYGVTILAPASTSIVHVAPGTMVEVPSIGLASLRDAHADGGIELLRDSLENLLGVRFGATAELAPASLAEAVRTVGPLTIVVDDAVTTRGATGRVSIVVPQGRQAVEADGVLGVLEPVGDGTSLDRLVRHQAFWDAYLDALGDDAPAGGFVPISDAMEVVAAEDVRHQVLPVEAVAGIDGDDELFRVLDDELDAMVARLFPGSTAPEDRVRVRILNGAGAPGLAQRVQPLLVDVGGEVTLSGNADRFDYAVTQIVYYDDARLADANAIRDALGVGEVVKSRTPLEVVDVTIVVGTDFLARDDGG